MYILIKILINSNIHKVWDAWNKDEHINQWYSGHEDWHTSKAINKLQVGNSFMFTMKSKMGHEYFKFKGEYTAIIDHKLICYFMEDKRKVLTNFKIIGNKVLITQKIEPDTMNSYEPQVIWWKTIMLNFKKYVESQYDKANMN